jgi:hypothetical protein
VDDRIAGLVDGLMRADVNADGSVLLHITVGHDGVHIEVTVAPDTATAVFGRSPLGPSRALPCRVGVRLPAASATGRRRSVLG